ncbi:MAG: hypothetical protein IJO42_02290 [Clostridia bacterium]|nr:hypothetical protein [Clostridia bacterium]
MREKIFKVANTVYGVLMTVSFFGGVLPLIPFIIALIVGGNTGEAIALFLYNDYYPWVILAGSIAVVVGLIAMYIGKLEGLSIKKVSADGNTDDDTPKEN